jgi:hypothetical protein
MRRTQGTRKTEAMIAACCAGADSTQGPFTSSHIRYALSWQQSFDNFETTASHPNLTCVTQIFHATESGLAENAGMTMARIIEFYIPNNFRKRVKWVSPEQRGKIIEFASPMKKSA